MSFTVRFVPDAARPAEVSPKGLAAARRAPRVKPNGPVFIRFYGGFVVGDMIADLSTIAVSGFIVGVGVAFPIAHREDMELQVDVSYVEYSGDWVHPGGSLSLNGKEIGPAAHYLYNFVREGRRVTPFVGGGLSLAHTEKTATRVFAGPFGTGTSELTTTDRVVSLQGVGGVQFAARSKVTFRAEGRIGLRTDGPLVLVLGGISF